MLFPIPDPCSIPGKPTPLHRWNSRSRKGSQFTSTLTWILNIRNAEIWLLKLMRLTARLSTLARFCRLTTNAFSCHKIALVLPLSILPRGCGQGTLTWLWILVWRHSSWCKEQNQSLLITPCQSLSLPQLRKALGLIWTLSSSILLRQSSTKMQLGQEGGSRIPRQPQLGWHRDVLTGMGPEMQVAKKGLERLFQEGKTGNKNKEGKGWAWDQRGTRGI